MSKNTLFKKFIIKYIFIFNIYGYLYFIAALFAFFSLYYLFHISLNLIFVLPLAVVFLLSGIFALYQTFSIETGVFRKWKFYKITIYRIEKKGYKDYYFEPAMYEPCMRIISKDILKQFNLQSEYKSLLKKYGKTDQKIKKKKQELLSSLYTMGAKDENIDFK